jgi:hypothetical protein
MVWCVKVEEEWRPRDLALKVSKLRTTIELRMAWLQGVESGQRGPTKRANVDQGRRNNDAIV